MKTAKDAINSTISSSVKARRRPRPGLGGWLAVGVTLLVAGLVQAQTNITIKPFQVRFEVPVGLTTNLYLTNCNLRIPTNGATGVDGTGTNWIIANVNVSISGAPAGCTASLLNSDLATPVGSIPVNLNTSSTAKNTNLVVALAFNGTQTSGTSTLDINASGGGLADDVNMLTVEVGKIWNGTANAGATGPGNWSNPALWSSAGAPGPNDNVVFTDVGAQTNSLITSSTSTNLLTNSVIDATTVISSLRFSQTNSSATNIHNLVISPGATLAIKGNEGFKMLRDYTFENNVRMFVNIWGTNGTFVQTNENSDFSILIDGASGNKTFGNLDMAGLSKLVLDVNQLQIGDSYAYPYYLNLATNGYTSGSTMGSSLPNKMNPNWVMAQTNVVRAVYVDPDNYTNADDRNYSLMLGRNNITGGSSGNDAIINMGASNVFYMDSICVAGYACLGGVLQFQNPGSYALFRNTDGVSRMSQFVTADAAGTTYGSTSGAATKAGPIDFSKGYVDMLVDKFYLSRDRGHRIDSGGQSQTAFVMADGVIDANTAILGFQNEGSQSNISYCYATMVVSNTALFKVNDTLTLGYTSATNGSGNTAELGYGQITIGPGGMVAANSIAVGGLTKLSSKNMITIMDGGNLLVSNNIADATPGGELGTLDLKGNATLTLFINGTNPAVPLVYVTNLLASGTGNKLAIGGVINVTNYPIDIPLIAGGANEPAISPSAFDAGVVMPSGSGLTGVLTLSSSNTINLRIINRAPNNLVWRGPGTTADWDRTTKNWLDMNTGILTNYNDPDIVSFDDTPGFATNINVTGGPLPFSPTAINMTNSIRYYTFVDGGNSIIGSAALNKYGTGTVEVDANTGLSAQLNQGALVGSSSGALGGANVTAGTVMNFSGTIAGSVLCSGTGTTAGNVAGTLTVQPGGVFTNAGTVGNPFVVQTNGYLFNSGTLNNIGTGSSGSPQVTAGGILVNNGNINGDVLFVSGIFEDLGTPGMTLTSMTLAPGATFYPGGEGIGNTSINSDGVGNFPGAALLQQGSTTVFKVDPTTPANTVLTADHLSFGGSSSQQTQTGCTLMITNVSGTPFSAGQTFQLFANIFNPAIGPFNTGSSTNTFPTMIPATPGPGLVWDLRNLWVPNSLGHNGVIGVISATAGRPALTNSFTTLGGTNIVGQFSWDPNNQGMRLESLTTPATVGLTPNTNYNWAGIPGSWTNTTAIVTNKLVSTNDVFYRLVFP
jgi:hypothetical protein